MPEDMPGEPPRETFSPLTNLLRITRQIVHYQVSEEFKAMYALGDGNYLVGPLVSFFSGRRLTETRYTTLEMLDDYVQVCKICTEATRYVNRNSPVKAKYTNNAVIENIVNMYAVANIGSSAAYMHQFNTDFLDKAEMIDANISDREVHYAVSQDEIKSIREKIDGLIDTISNSGFEDEIKSRLIFTLIAMLDGVTRINFIGPEKMLENIDIFLGQGFQNVIVHNQEPEKQANAMGILRNGVEIAESAQKVIEASAVIIPIFKLGFGKLLELLPMLPKF